jgi:hypothetical protein
VAALVDTNVLVYRFDGRFPAKQRMEHGRLHGSVKVVNPFA